MIVTVFWLDDKIPEDPCSGSSSILQVQMPKIPDLELMNYCFVYDAWMQDSMRYTDRSSKG